MGRSLGLAEFLLASQLLRLLELLGVLLLHQELVGLHPAVALAHKGHQLAHQLVALLASLVPGLLVLLLHGPLLPAVGALAAVVLLLPGKVLAGAEALPVGVEQVHHLRNGNTVRPGSSGKSKVSLA